MSPGSGRIACAHSHGSWAPKAVKEGRLGVSTSQDPACILFANVSYMAKPRFKGWRKRVHFLIRGAMKYLWSYFQFTIACDQIFFFGKESKFLLIKNLF